MRTFLIVGALAAVASVPPLGPTLAQPAPRPNEPLNTPEQHGEENLGNAASAPMHDMNIFRQKIPDVLLAAVADPYARPPRSCAALVARVAELTEALGPDLDHPANEERVSRGKRNQSLGLSLLHVASESLLPFSGAVRALSGAEKHDHQVLAAIIAGGVRRGYLKGLGEAHGCYPPATPRHLLNPPPPMVEEGVRKPLYPAR